MNATQKKALRAVQRTLDNIDWKKFAERIDRSLRERDYKSRKGVWRMP